MHILHYIAVSAISDCRAYYLGVTATTNPSVEARATDYYGARGSSWMAGHNTKMTLIVGWEI